MPPYILPVSMGLCEVSLMVILVDLGGIVGLPVHPVGVCEGLAAGVDEGALSVQVVGPQPVGGQTPRNPVSCGGFSLVLQTIHQF